MVFLAPAIGWAQAEEGGCGTELRPEDVEVVRELMKAGVYDPPGPITADWIVPVSRSLSRFHDAPLKRSLVSSECGRGGR